LKPFVDQVEISFGQPYCLSERFWRIGKFQNCVKIKLNYAADKKNTPEDFSDNFHHIKYFLQVDHLEKKILKNSLIFPIFSSRKIAGKFSRWAKSITYKCQITVLKFQENPTTTRFRI
jgi:hypothetical protein